MGDGPRGGIINGTVSALLSRPALAVVGAVRRVLVALRPRRRREAHHDPATGCCPTSWALGAEAERQRIASELHDHVAPTMAVLGLELDRLRRQASDEELRPGLERVRDDVRAAMVEVREVLGDLRRAAPPDGAPAAEERAPRNGRGRWLHAVPGPRGDPAGRR